MKCYCQIRSHCSASSKENGCFSIGGAQTLVESNKNFAGVESKLSEGKCLIFTQYADTARYLFENLNPDGKRDYISVIYSGDKSKERIVRRFAPKANPEHQFQRGESELLRLIATDVLAKGLNLQDCNKIINYDLHWNPVRLIQRFGRIDRIGSEYDQIYGFNFLPETGIERNLGLQEKLRNRIQEIQKRKFYS
ncbi:SWF/SNF helicase family protein [Candidatus Poribacteria bacterium]|nr:SWF/SNF helicase family protein [Candidatus Poribacteria bacterium]